MPGTVLGPIALVASRADTVGNALASMVRNLPCHVARTSLRLDSYSEQRSLSRACRRWFGTSPAALRAGI